MPVIQLELDSRGAVTSLQKFDRAVDKTANNTDSSFGRMKKSVSNVAAGIATIAVAMGAAAAAFSLKAVSMASSMVETQGVFDQAFKGMTDQAEAYAEHLGAAYHLTDLEAKKSLNTIQLVLTGMGKGTQEAMEMSNNLVKVGADIGAAFDTATADVVRDIRSAISGSTETMDKYGVVVRQAEINQKALSMGLANTKAEITQADKATATYNLILEKTKAITGTTAREAEGYAGQLKEAKKIVGNLTVAIGEQLLPIFTRGIKAFNDWAKANDVVSKAGLWTVKVIHFIHDGLNGLILLPYAINAAMATMFDFMIAGLIKIMTPLNLLAEGLVKLGAIENNPFVTLRAGVTDYKSAMTEAFDKQHEKVLATSASYDRLEADLQRQVDAHRATKAAGVDSNNAIENSVRSTTGAVEEADDGMYGYKTALELAGETGTQEMDSVTESTKELISVTGGAIGEVEGLETAYGGVAIAAEKAAAASSKAASVGGEIAFSEQELLYRKLNPARGVNLATQMPSLEALKREEALRGGTSGGIVDTRSWQPGLGVKKGPSEENNVFGRNLAGGSTVNINVNQSVSRSDIVSMATELDRSAVRR